MNILGRTEEINSLSAVVLLKFILGKNKLNKVATLFAKELAKTNDLSSALSMIEESIIQ